MRRLAAACGVLVALGLASAVLPARAASVTPFNPQQLQIPATGADFNALIFAINAILQPLLPTVSGSVNAISLTPAITGSPAILGLQPGGDANAAIQINPSGTGNVVLFAGAGDTGVLQIANATSWYPAKGAGIVPCPGGGAAAASLAGGLLQAGGQTVAGYEAHEDWLGRPYWVPGCR